jgi:pimeloyl-ACP methyl ester carboxylesterase
MYCEKVGEGTPVVLLHAGVADSRMWDVQFRELAKYHCVVRCDLRGFGRSRKAPGEFSHFSDVAALLTQLGIDNATVIGASFGGSVAIDLTLESSNMVERLVLAAPALGGYQFKSEEMLAFFAAEEESLSNGNIAAASELNLKVWVDGFGRDSDRNRDDVRVLVNVMLNDIFSKPAVDDAREIELTPPALDRLNEITVPTLVLVGENDVPEFQVIAKLISERIRNAQHAVVPGAAHLINLEKPQQFMAAVANFLATTTSR